MPSLPAEPLEQHVLQEIARLLHQPELIMQVYEFGQEKEPALTYEETAEALHQLSAIWDELFPNEQQRIAQLLIKRIDVKDDGLKIFVHNQCLPNLANEMQGANL